MQIGTDRDWQVAIAGQYSHTAAIKDDGTLWAWGNNDHGQLGDGTIVEKHAPVQIGTDTNWQSVVTESYSTVALKTDGTLWSWGNNWPNEDKKNPEKFTSDTNWQFVTAGYSHVVAGKSNNSLWSWGDNENGGLGLGKTWQETPLLTVFPSSFSWDLFLPAIVSRRHE